jgi:hypothetical protein
VIARGLEFQSHNSYSLLFKERDITDGWYIVYSGQICLYSSEPPKSPPKVPKNFRPDPSIDHMLHSLFERPFYLFRIVNPKEDFGSEDLTHDRIRTYVAVATMPSYVIHVDAHFYQMTSKWIDETEIAEFSNFLKEIPELAALEVHPECYDRLAERLERRVLRKGVDSDCLTGGWMIIEKGSIARYRFVDFSRVDIDQSRLVIGNVEIGLPESVVSIRTDVFGENHLVIDPTFSRGLRKPFTLSVIEEATVLVIPVVELPNLLPLDLKREVERIVLDDPTDKELVWFWVERERKRQWEIFKKRCTKEAREYVRMVNRQQLGMLVERRAKPPRAIKKIDPRKQKFRKVSEALFQESIRI